MAGAPSEPTQEQLDRIPSGYCIEPINDRWAIRCYDCGHRWYTDRMTHTANIVFLLDHRWRHVDMRQSGKRCGHVKGVWLINGELRCWACGATKAGKHEGHV